MRESSGFEVGVITRTLIPVTQIDWANAHSQGKDGEETTRTEIYDAPALGQLDVRGSGSRGEWLVVEIGLGSLHSLGRNIAGKKGHRHAEAGEKDDRHMRYSNRKRVSLITAKTVKLNGE